MMKASAEVRWFFAGEVPAAVSAWFRRGGLWEQEPERVDEYLLLPGCDSAGIKLREGRFEVKARTGAARPVGYAHGVSGLLEEWIKWSRALPEGLPAPNAVYDVDERWLRVGKRRTLRCFSLDGTEAGDDPHEVGVGDERPRRGCGIEITEVVLGDDEPSPHWTLALEGFDADGPPREPMERVARHFFAAEPCPAALEQRTSRSYVQWLVEVTTAAAG